jgi:hypothetical protein
VTSNYVLSVIGGHEWRYRTGVPISQHDRQTYRSESEQGREWRGRIVELGFIDKIGRGNHSTCEMMALPSELAKRKGFKVPPGKRPIPSAVLHLQRASPLCFVMKLSS